VLELEVACKDPADLFIQIIAHTQGAWTVSEVEKAIKVIQELTPPKPATIKTIK